MDLTLVILAAGIGSRYGGVKQAAPVGPHGEFLVDYSIYDAMTAGFTRVALVVRREIEPDLRDTLGQRIGHRVPLDYVLQDIPPDRAKPWGTGHAVLVCRHTVRTPFAVVNADDFCGRPAYQALATFLKTANGRGDYAMAGYALKNTLSAHGSVSRGLCKVDAAGFLIGIEEHTRIAKSDVACFAPPGAPARFTGNEVVSVNAWAFTPDLFDTLDNGFRRFTATLSGADAAKAEYFLPSVIHDGIRDGRARVRVLDTASEFFGITNPEDLADVRRNLRERITAGEYPERLWEDTPRCTRDDKRPTDPSPCSG